MTAACPRLEVIFLTTGLQVLAPPDCLSRRDDIAPKHQSGVMMHNQLLRCLLSCLLGLGMSGQVSSSRAEQWSGWRGPRGDGTSREAGLPTKWDGPSGTNIAWQVEVPGTGHASPIIWQDRLFLVSCLEESQQRILLCLDRRSGRLIWRRNVMRSPLETKHNRNSFASSTPATDGSLIYVSFLEVDGTTVSAPNVSRPRPVTPGRMVVAAYDFEGNEQWRTAPGEFVSAHGYCSSPVLYKDMVIVNGDHDGDGYLVALDRLTGDVRWKVARAYNTRSYVTPIIRRLDHRVQMILSGSKSVASFDPDTGRRHWIMDGPTEQFVASMVDDGELVFLTAGFPEKHILAIRPDGHDNIGDSHIVWRTTRGAAYVPSPIVEGPYLLVVSDGGIASCFDTASGQRHWMQRIGPGYSASPIAARGLVYYVADDGATTVIRPGKTFEVVAKNELGEHCSASPAVSRGQIYLRGERHLFCIGDAMQAETASVGD